MMGRSIVTDGVAMHVMVSELGGPMRIRIIEGDNVSPLMKLTNAQVEELMDALDELSVGVTEDDTDEPGMEEGES